MCHTMSRLNMVLIRNNTSTDLWQGIESRVARRSWQFWKVVSILVGSAIGRQCYSRMVQAH